MKTKHQRFMSVARALARVSEAPDLRVGCVIVYSGQIIASGWNYEDNIMPALHAEVRAINLVPDAVNKLPIAEMYVTTSPCLACATRIVALHSFRIVRVYYQHEWWDKAALKLLQDNNIETIRIKRESRQ